MEPQVTEPPPVAAPPRLTRSRDDRVIAGVCGGLGRYLGVDPVLIRVATVIFVLLAGTGLLAYLIAWIVIPEEEPATRSTAATTAAPSGERTGAMVFGVVLVGVGTLLLLDRVVPFLSWRYVGPLVLIAIGVLVVMKGGGRR